MIYAQTPLSIRTERKKTLKTVLSVIDNSMSSCISAHYPENKSQLFEGQKHYFTIFELSLKN